LLYPYIFISGLIEAQKFLTETGEFVIHDGLSHLSHQPDDKTQVMYCGQTVGKQLFCLEQVMQVSSAKSTAGLAITALINWPIVSLP
jgi:hypothetical protein